MSGFAASSAGAIHGELRKIARMAEMLGAKVIFVGLKPGIIVHLLEADADVHGVRAFLGLDEALHALEQRPNAEPHG